MVAAISSSFLKFPLSFAENPRSSSCSSACFVILAILPAIAFDVAVNLEKFFLNASMSSGVSPISDRAINAAAILSPSKSAFINLDKPTDSFNPLSLNDGSIKRFPSAFISSPFINGNLPINADNPSPSTPLDAASLNSSEPMVRYFKISCIVSARFNFTLFNFPFLSFIVFLKSFPLKRSNISLSCFILNASPSSNISFAVLAEIAAP